MKKNLLLGMAIALGLTTSINAQERYLDEIYTDADIIVVDSIPYGVNINFLTSDFSNAAAAGADIVALQTIAITGGGAGAYPMNYFLPNALIADSTLHTVVKITAVRMDVYMPSPAVDSKTDRPVIFYAHTGSFLPKAFNGQATGDRMDSAAVELCKQWAKRGYVAVSVDYRTGWNPIAADLDTRTGTLLNAVYRSVHDMKQAVRVAKLSVLGGNPFGINPDKMVVYGQGSGGYTSLAYGSMTQQAELELDKFKDVNGDSYINTALVGGIDGFGGQVNLYQDTFSAFGVTSDVQMVVNAGGALADISWIEAGEPAIVSLHCIRDAYAPFDTGTVIVPTTQEVVVDVNGPGTYMKKVNDLGNNDAFIGRWGGDAYSITARSRYGHTFDYIYAAPKDEIFVDWDVDGLFPFDIAKGASVFQNTGAPWEWWNKADLDAYVAYYNQFGAGLDADAIDASSLFSNPDGHDKSHALAYIDTIQGYMNPRVMRVLEIGNWEALGVDELVSNDLFSVYPNPANEVVTISSKGGNVNMVTIHDITGRMVYQEVANVTTLKVNINELPKGVYVISVRTEEGENVEKLIIE
jgi:hypothetical protein